jgi:hypothetical protein
MAGLFALADPPPQAEWLMLDDEQRASWEEMHLLTGKKQLLRWGQLPDEPAAIVRLRVVAASRELCELPASLRELPCLRYLDIDRRYVKKLAPDTLPGSVRALRIAGDGSAVWPARLSLPGLTRLNASSVALKFTPAELPGLRWIGIKLAGNAAMLDVVARYADLQALDVVTVNAPTFFTAIAALPLLHLGISGGKLDTLGPIDALSRLEQLYLTRLSGLSSLAGVDHLAALEELSIGYCTRLRGLREILALRSLRRLAVIGCKDVGVAAVARELSSMHLEHLDTSGSR